MTGRVHQGSWHRGDGNSNDVTIKYVKTVLIGGGFNGVGISI